MEFDIMRVPLIVNNKIVDTVLFRGNLTLRDVPDYVNFNYEIGLTRLTRGKYKGRLCLMWYSELYEETSYAELISEEEAYKLCYNRGKLDVAELFDIEPVFEEE